MGAQQPSAVPPAGAPGFGPSVSVSGARVMCCSPSRPSSVLGDVIFLCRLMCFLLSGRLPFAMRLLPRSVVLAAVLLSLSASV